MKLPVVQPNVRRTLWLCFLLCLGILVLLPVFHPGFLVTDDGDWMIIRLSAFYQTLREGQFPVRFLGRLNYNYGYPVANFLYPGFMYVGSLIHLLGASFQASIEYVVVGFVFLGALSVFLWLERSFDTRAGALGAAVYLLNPYLIYDIVKRGSVGEIVAMGTAALAMYAFSAGIRWLIPPVVAFLVISHNTLALFFVIFFVGYILIRRKWDLLFPLWLGVGSSAFFWIPVFYENRFIVFNQTGISDPRHFFPAGNALIAQSLPFVAMAAASLFLARKGAKPESRYFTIVFTVSCFLASSLSSPIWQNQLFTKLVQFPYRFLAFVSLMGPWFAAAVAEKKYGLRFGLPAVAAGICILAVMVSPYSRAQSIVRPEGFYTTNEASTTVADEYMPKWVQRKPSARASNKVEIHRGNAVVTGGIATSEKIDILIHAKEATELQINTIYYPGWGATLDETPVTISHDNEMGIMRVGIPVGDHRLFMAFRETKSRFLADMFSLFCIGVWAVHFVIMPRFAESRGSKKRITK